jgi:serine/threonine-protein kinase HipA
MRTAKITFKGTDAGTLTQHDDGTFTFAYREEWLIDTLQPAISLTFPKAQKVFHSKYLFPFFFNMLPEGSNKQVVCQLLKIDPDDYFGLLMAVAKNDTIGAVRVIKMQ